MSSSRASSRPRYQIHVSCLWLAGGFFTAWPLLSQIMDNKIKKDQKKKKNPPQMPLLKSWSFQQEVGSKSRVLEHAPCTQRHKGVGRTPKPPRWPCPWTHPCPQTRWGVFPVVPNQVLRDKSVLFMHVGSRARQSEFKSQGRRLLAPCLYLSSPMEVIVWSTFYGKKGLTI